MAVQEHDIQPMLDQLGVLATIGGITAKVLFDRVSRAVLPPEAPPISGKLIRITAWAGAFGAITAGTMIDVNGNPLRAHYVRSVLDGPVTEIFCQVV